MKELRPWLQTAGLTEVSRSFSPARSSPARRPARTTRLLALTLTSTLSVSHSQREQLCAGQGALAVGPAGAGILGWAICGRTPRERWRDGRQHLRQTARLEGRNEATWHGQRGAGGWCGRPAAPAAHLSGPAWRVGAGWPVRARRAHGGARSGVGARDGLGACGGLVA